MSGKAVLDAFSDLCRSRVRYYCMTRLTYLGRQKRLYLCVAADALFFLKKDLSRLVSGGEIMLYMIQYVVVDTSSDGRALIYLNPSEINKGNTTVWRWGAPSASGRQGGGPPPLTGGPLIVETEYRDSLLKWIEVVWCSDFALRRGRIGRFPKYLINVKDENTENLTAAAHLPQIQPFIGTQQVEKAPSPAAAAAAAAAVLQ